MFLIKFFNVGPFHISWSKKFETFSHAAVMKSIKRQTGIREGLRIEATSGHGRILNEVSGEEIGWFLIYNR